MSRYLDLRLPDECSATHVASLLPARRAARPTSDFEQESLQVMWTGDDHDREEARQEISSALAELGIDNATLRFFDEQ